METIRVFSRQDAERFEPKTTHAWISITTPGDDIASIPYRKTYSSGILRSQFHDIDDGERSSGTDSKGNYYIIPDELHAREIYHFVNMCYKSIRDLFIHCDAGISRSAGVAAALAKIYFDNNDKFFEAPYYPNRRIYRLIMELHNRISTKV